MSTNVQPIPNEGHGRYLFGFGDGTLPRQADVIARKHGSILVNQLHPKPPRYWFESQDKPLSAETTKRMFDELLAANLISRIVWLVQTSTAAAREAQ